MTLVVVLLLQGLLSQRHYNDQQPCVPRSGQRELHSDHVSPIPLDMPRVDFIVGVCSLLQANLITYVDASAFGARFSNLYEM